jgi:DNA processing protein
MPIRSAERDALDPRDDAPAARARLRAWLALQRRGAFEPARTRRLLERDGDPVAALAALSRETPAQVLGEAAFERERATLVRVGARLVPFGAPAYPARLAELPDAAPLLVVRGALARLDGVFVAIVGARVPTRLGREIAESLARDLGACGVGVVSGLARGIDAAAHRGALAARGATVAMLGCGIDRSYPPEHEALADEIAEQGAVVSELPLGAPPAKHHFPLRNRLISALARAVVVVEARAKSGSLGTARHAADQGREVLAVPGALDAATSEGPNRLLRAGAWPVLDAGDVLAAIGLGPASATERAALAPRDEAPRAASAHPIVRALRDEPRTRDELVAALGWSAQRLAAELVALELDGAIVEERDGRLRVAPRPQ